MKSVASLQVEILPVTDDSVEMADLLLSKLESTTTDSSTLLEDKVISDLAVDNQRPISEELSEYRERGFPGNF